ERGGGVHGAVARLAETAYERLTPAEATTARHILIRLAGDAEADAAVRRQVPLSELDLGRGGPARRVLDILTESRLLTIGGETVEVAHEALLREWPRLRGWLEQDAEGRRLHPPAHQRRARLAGPRARSRRPVPRRDARGRARVAARPRRRAHAGRERLPRGRSRRRSAGTSAGPAADA